MNKKSQGEVRIIGGQWRGRKLIVPDFPGLRPTPDRVRETLFNWLMMLIPGSHCLDPFAGSGVLGFEALSRGAASVVMIDQSKEVTQLLQQESKRFNSENLEIYCATMPQNLKKPKNPFDIVFLDPPYQENLLLPMCFYLQENGFLSSKAYIYLESKEIITDAMLPKNWKILKSKKAGQVMYHLAVNF